MGGMQQIKEEEGIRRSASGRWVGSPTHTNTKHSDVHLQSDLQIHDTTLKACGQDHAFLQQFRDELVVAIADVSQKCEANFRLLDSFRGVLQQGASIHGHEPAPLDAYPDKQEGSMW